MTDLTNMVNSTIYLLGIIFVINLAFNGIPSEKSIKDYYIDGIVGKDPNGFFYSPFTKGELYFITAKISIQLTIYLMLMFWCYLVLTIFVKSGIYSLMILVLSTGGFAIIDPVISASAIILFGYIQFKGKFNGLFLALSTLPHLSGLYTSFILIKNKIDLTLFVISLLIMQQVLDIYSWSFRSYNHYSKFVLELPIGLVTIFNAFMNIIIGILPMALYTFKIQKYKISGLFVLAILLQTFNIMPEMNRYITPLLCIVLYESKETEIRPYAISTILLYVFVKFIIKI